MEATIGLGFNKALLSAILSNVHENCIRQPGLSDIEAAAQKVSHSPSPWPCIPATSRSTYCPGQASYTSASLHPCLFTSLHFYPPHVSCLLLQWCHITNHFKTWLKQQPLIISHRFIGVAGAVLLTWARRGLLVYLQPQHIAWGWLVGERLIWDDLFLLHLISDPPGGWPELILMMEADVWERGQKHPRLLGNLAWPFLLYSFG